MAGRFPRFVRAIQFNLEDPYGFYNDRVDAGFVAGLAERLHADMVIVFARDGWGRAFYPSSIYPRHPRSALDLGELAERLHAAGKKLVVMACHTSNRFLYERRPDWAQRGPRGELRVLDHHPSMLRVEPEWPLMCPNSPAGRLYVEEAGEALDATAADGLLLDSLRYMPDPGRACFCRWCRTRFREETGYEDIPVSPSGGREAEYREAWEWRYRVTRRLVEAVAAEVHGRGGWLLYNNHPGGWSGRGLRFAEELADLLDAVFAEASEEDVRGPWWRSFIVKASLAVSGWRPVLSTRNAFPLLVPPASAPPVLLEHSLWSMVAAGASPVVTFFASTIFEDPRFVETVARVYGDMGRVADLLAEREPAADVALLYSSLSHDWHIHDNPEAYIGELMGLAKGLSMLGLSWAIVSTRRVQDVARLGAGLVVAADNGVAEPGLEDGLRRLIEQGARLLATGFPGTREPGGAETWRLLLQDEAGIAYEGAARPGTFYVENRGLPGAPHRVAMGAPDPGFQERRWDPALGETALVAARGARMVAALRQPRAPYGYEYTLGRSHPPPGAVLGPAVTASPDGRIVYHAYRLGLHLHRVGLPDHLSLLEASLRLLGVKPRAWLEETPGLVELHTYRVGEGLLVHLVNNCWHRVVHALPEATTPGAAPGFEPPMGLAVPRRAPSCGPVTLAVRVGPGARLLARDPLRGTEERVEAGGDGVARLRLVLDGVHLMLHLVPRG